MFPLIRTFRFNQPTYGFLRLALSDREDILRDRSYFIWIPRWS